MKRRNFLKAVGAALVVPFVGKSAPVAAVEKQEAWSSGIHLGKNGLELPV